MGPLKRVLVVDDEESLRHMLVVLLKREGYEPTAVPSGEAALAELARQAFDVVLSDVRMPKLTGLELVLEAAAAGADRRDARERVLEHVAGRDVGRRIARGVGHELVVLDEAHSVA